jgi:hypothetical protein
VEGVRLTRPLAPGRYPLARLVTGLENVPPLMRLLGDERKGFLEQVVAEIVDDWGYMWVDNDDGTLYASAKYWNETGDERGLYLDLVHELVHVKQQREGRELFDHAYKYVERPTELEAYRVVAEEARRLGMSDRELSEFLYVEWISHDDHAQLCRAVGVPYFSKA